ncbi:KUP/HAK/KT family potassium transporter [Brachybacterium huguangmaarense]|uniref:Probable potassium transport system protein Kup n=1 Tax=Brachybacterium huguangmaarense TaxID=1652028 RepID=A0ABY6FZC5_9MICO|nr:KUP/HAK/KT family potassium transporter [Brachybacterium huguangmaarense]UYG16074.1 KUP/HAK/KT family potassium transporter [Brachybacterium huguangmaarense]
MAQNLRPPSPSDEAGNPHTEPAATGTQDAEPAPAGHSPAPDGTAITESSTAPPPSGSTAAPEPAAETHSHTPVLGPDGRPRARRPLMALMIGAIGVVFGDIGTSPLYALQTVFSVHHNAVSPSEEDVLGIISMVTWCLMLIVSFTYVGVILRADNQGEGGILSLAALVRRKLGLRSRQAAIGMILAIIGASLFYGDSLITPAISVLSAFEGLEVANPSLAAYVVPAAVTVLALLFLVQRWGTGVIGRAFGPIMVLWFVVIGVLGLPRILENPSILRAVSPTYAFAFALDRPVVAFIAMGAVVLAVTGAEALYADMGHFGRRPIAFAWFCLILPALLINYYGQGAMILRDASTVDNPFFHLAPPWARIPLVVLATCATVIASQAVISGAFSVSRQATRSSILPRLRVMQTSREVGGQIYVPVVNAILFVGVLALVLTFRSSERLASAYGLSVTGTLMLELSLFLLLAYRVWKWALWRVVLMAVVVGGLELSLFGANVVKVASGGWLPLVIAAIALTVMLTWKRGSKIMFGRRAEMEGPIEDFVAEVKRLGVPRVPGLAVYPHGDVRTTPLALRSNVEFNHVLHEHVVIVTIKNIGVPHVRHDARISVSDLGDEDDGIVHVLCRVGFNDSQDVPKALRLAAGKCRELDIDPEEATYMLSVFRIEPGDDRCMPHWQKSLFRFLEKFSANRTQVLHLPPTRTIVMGAEAEL